MRLPVLLLTFLLNGSLVISESALDTRTNRNLETVDILTNKKGEKSFADPKSCSGVGEYFGYIERNKKFYLAGAAATYSLPEVTRGLCTMLGDHITTSHRYRCTGLAEVVRGGIIGIFAIVQAQKYTFKDGVEDVARFTTAQEGLAEILRSGFLESGYSFEKIKTLSNSRIRRTEESSDLQGLVAVTGVGAGNHTFDLTYRQFVDGQGSITIVPTSFGTSVYGPLRLDALGHDGYGIQIHYTTRHWSPGQEPDDRRTLASAIARYWADQTAQHDKAGLVGFVETAPPEGSYLYEWKGRKVMREANFY
jgi:hypothetical protein